MVFLAVDTGATNTTVWLVENGRISGEFHRPVGVRNTSIAGSRSLLEQTLREGLRALSQQARSSPRFVVAAGMLTSSLGLVEIPHVVAPAGPGELARHVRMKRFEAISPLPFFLVPGVRTRPGPCRLDDLGRADIIRGEETEIVGLLTRERRTKPWLFLHLGSHAKVIQVDGQGRIVRSTTTLSGECLHALRTQTILASRLARWQGARLVRRFFDQGCRQAQRHGVLRALFMVRLLEENRSYGPPELYSFLLGALLASDLQAFQSQGLVKAGRTHVVVSGRPDLIKAWSWVLGKKHHFAVVDASARARSFVAGLRAIVFASPAFHRFLAGKRRS